MSDLPQISEAEFEVMKIAHFKSLLKSYGCNKYIIDVVGMIVNFIK